MTTRLDVLDQILEDLKNNLTRANGYNHTPAEIKRGYYVWEDFLLKPAIGFSMDTDIPADDQLYGEDTRFISVFFYIYSQTDGAGNTDQIYEMLEDLENFFQSSDHFTYQEQILIEDAQLLEGGVSQPINTAILQTQILYES